MDGRGCVRAARRSRVSHAAVIVAEARTTAVTAMPPATSTIQSAEYPGSGSAFRARPIGMIGDASHAPTAARTAPPIAAGTVSNTSAARRPARVTPSSPKVSSSACALITWRPTACPRATTAATAATIAKTTRPDATAEMFPRAAFDRASKESVSYSWPGGINAPIADSKSAAVAPSCSPTARYVVHSSTWPCTESRNAGLAVKPPSALGTRSLRTTHHSHDIELATAAPEAGSTPHSSPARASSSRWRSRRRRRRRGSRRSSR